MSTQDTATQLAALVREIEQSCPEADVELTPFPSGSVMLDVRIGGRLYVLEYSPTRGYGVDEVREGEGFQLAYSFASDDFDSAAERLRELVSSTSPTTGNA